MKINEGKCRAWVDVMFALLKMTKELSVDEKDYILANFSIALGNLKLQELEEKSRKLNNETVKIAVNN